MKRILTMVALAFSVLLGSSTNKASAQVNVGVNVSFQTFYDELSPYGRWIDYPEYGYVWAPSLGPDFQPYSTGGQWVWSDEYDWMWVSDYDWGWAPFHYGNWFYDDYYGWMWVPGYDWSPAWVSWRTGGDYYGWAPLRPGISINIGFGNYNPPYNYWCFAPRRYINHRNIGSYCIDRSRNVTIINTTTIINNYGNRNNVFVTGGPRRHDAERYTGRIRSVNFRDSDRPGGREFRNNTVRVYRPQVQRDNNDRRFAPRSFDRYNRDNANGNVARSRSDNFRERRNDIGNRDFDNRQNDNVNSDANNRRRDMIERNNERRNNGDFNRQNNNQQQDNNDRRTNRRNIFERNNTNSERPNNDQPNIDRFRQRREEINQRQNQVRQNDQRRNNEEQFNQRRNERREVFRRNENSNGQNERREMRNQNPIEQNNRQIDRSSRESRQFENRSNENRNREQRSDNNNRGSRRFERRNG